MKSGPRGGIFFDGEEFVAKLILPKSFPRFKYEGAVVISVAETGDLSVIPEKETKCFAAASTTS